MARRNDGNRRTRRHGMKRARKRYEARHARRYGYGVRHVDIEGDWRVDREDIVVKCRVAQKAERKFSIYEETDPSFGGHEVRGRPNGDPFGF